MTISPNFFMENLSADETDNFRWVVFKEVKRLTLFVAKSVAPESSNTSTGLLVSLLMDATWGGAS